MIFQKLARAFKSILGYGKRQEFEKICVARIRYDTTTSVEFGYARRVNR